MSDTDSTSQLLDMHGSLDRILKSENHVGDAFYPSFMARFPEIREYFQGINLHRLTLLLPMALSVIYQHHAHHYPSTRKYLEYVGSHHSLRGIPPAAYPKFREALLAALEQMLKDDWHPGLAKEWSAAIDEAVETMLSAYGTRVTI